nr:ABC transporter permease subunit [Clostridium swellfunianum]
MIEDPYFFTVLKNTLIINFGKLLIGFPAPIILAIMLSEIKKERFKKFVQTVSYMPHFLSWVVLAGMLLEILSPSRGPINAIITALGFKPVFFITEPYWFRKILVGSEIWKGIGFGAIIYLAAISGINPEQYEAAEVDGINRFQKLIYITIPSIMPVIIIMLILRAGNIINDDFEQVFNLMNAKVMEVGDVLSTYTYRQGLINMNMSYGAAVGLFKNVIALIMVLSANFVASKISDDTLF